MATPSNPPWGTDRNKATLPKWMDPNGTQGQVTILSMVPKDGKFPNNPFVIGKSIQQAAGKIAEASTENRGTRYILKVRSQDQVNKLLALTELIDGTKVEVILHPTLNFVRCKVNCVEAINASEEELLEDLKPQGVQAVRRITRNENGVTVNTPTLILTISGTVIPRHIVFDPLVVRTQIYYPSPMTCFNCLDVGHTKTRCRAEGRCRNCSENHQQVPGQNCSKPAFCFHCKEGHRPMFRGCKRFEMEKEIVSIKVNNNMTFPEAKKEYERTHSNTSYAAVSSVQNRLKEDAQQREIDLMRKEVERRKGLEQELNALRKILEELQIENQIEKKKKKRNRKNKKKDDDEQTSEAEMDHVQVKRKKEKAQPGSISPPCKKSVGEPKGYPSFQKVTSDELLMEEDFSFSGEEEGATGRFLDTGPLTTPCNGSYHLQ